MGKPRSANAADLRFADALATALNHMSDPRAPLQVGALRSLEVLGQAYPQHRQAIVDIICGLLRMRPVDGAVQRAAQAILAAHLRPRSGASFWPGMYLDLTAATLTDFDLTHCRIDGGLRAERAVFVGAASLRDATVGGPLLLRGARFSDHLWCDRAVFAGPVRLDATTFHADAWFGTASFAARTTFAAARFEGHAWFGSCRFAAPVDFSDAVFRRSVGFRGVQVAPGVGVNLTGTTFLGPARVSRRDDDGWSVSATGWQVEVDPDNESVGQLVWTGNGALIDPTPVSPP
jgi:hypothetical protein